MAFTAQIHSFGKYLPTARTTSAQIEAKLREENSWLHIPPGFFELMTGIQQKPLASEHEQVSDLAVKAGQDSLRQADLKLEDVDLLIFAAASQDVIEPATANIIQTKLGLTCPAFDVKNACNSFMNGIEVARAMVESGAYQNILVVSGEMPSRVVGYSFRDKREFKEAFASLTLGDGGGAAIVSVAPKSNVKYLRMKTIGEHWELATFLGGGSLHGNDPESMRFKGDGTTLKNTFLGLGSGSITDALTASKLDHTDITQVFLHQVATGFTDETLNLIGVPKDILYRTVEKQGNLASASLPIAISQALDEKKIKQDDMILIIGLASGISVGVMILELC